MTLADAKDSISCLAVLDAEIFVGSVDGRVRLYDIRMGRLSVDVIGRKKLY
jgi:mitogen-activated protein kinase organizer 1